MASAIARREIGCVELLDLHAARVTAYAPLINAIVVDDLDRARERALKLDRAAMPSGPLHGVPMTVKESFDVAGLPTTFGAPEYAANLPARSAFAVERLESAGAVVFGKTNVPRMLLEWQSFNDLYGVTNNPWDLSKTPGGSSGGAAAAIAAGCSALEIGSDIGGSIRVPAHMTGIFGHKPSWSLLPMAGHSLLGAVTPSDISAIGPLARSAADLQVAFDLLRGPDTADTALQLTLPRPRQETLRGLNVAVWPRDPVMPTDSEITAHLYGLAEFLAKNGANVRFTHPAFDVREAYEVFLKLLASAIGARFSREQLAAVEARAAAHAGSGSATAIMDRHYTISHSEWLQLNERRNVIRRIWQSFFGDFDVLLCPPFATAALPHDRTAPRDRDVVVDGQTIAYDDLLFWPGIIGGFYLPSTVAPLGLTKAGLPIGVQIAGPMHGDLQTLAFARVLEKQWRAFVPPPGF